MKRFIGVVISVVVLIISTIVLYNDFLLQNNVRNIKTYKLVGLNKADWPPNHNKKIIIALVDSGIDIKSKYIENHIIQGINLFNTYNNPYDDNGHGTKVASILISMIDYLNATDYIKIMPIKAINADGTCNLEKIYDGISFAINNGAQVVNLSVDSLIDSKKIKEIISIAEKKNVVLVASAGNRSSNIGFPAAYETVLAVGGITMDKQYDNLSDTGESLDVVAPSRVYAFSLDGRWRECNGTSLAAPQVAFASALVLAHSKKISSDQVRRIITNTAEDVGPKGKDEKFGYGILRLDNIHQELISMR